MKREHSDTILQMDKTTVQVLKEDDRQAQSKSRI